MRQAEGVDLWSVGLVALVVVGLTAIVYGALSDRAKNKRAAQQMLAPPRRPIPSFAPDAPAPHYLSELQARRPPPDAVGRDLSADERAAWRRRLDEPTTIRLDTGYTDAAYVTDTFTRWAVCERPRVLVCADPVQTVRELLPVLESLIVTRTPLVVVAPELAAEVRATLEVNTIQTTMPLLAVRASAAQRELVARACRATVLGRADLQSGYVRSSDLGEAECWLSDPRTSWIIGPPVPDAGTGS